MLQSRLLEKARQDREAEMNALKGDGGNSWGSQMRSYVLHPYQMVKDLRTDYEVVLPGRGLRRRDRRLHRVRHPLAPDAAQSPSRRRRARRSPRNAAAHLDSSVAVCRCVLAASELLYPAEATHVIRFENVSKIYDGQRRAALEDVNVDIEKGEFVFLVGASGSGKSTFLRLILREQRPTKGKVFVAGRELNKLHSWKIPAMRRQIGTVFQDFRLLPNKTVTENVAFALQVIGKPASTIRRVVPEVLELVGLDGKGGRLPEELSGGEQQRVAIARAFVNRPMILIADEPTGNLDPATSVGIMKLLDRINRADTTVVMATHDSTIVDQMRKRVIELDDGGVVRDQSRGVYGYQ